MHCCVSLVPLPVCLGPDGLRMAIKISQRKMNAGALGFYSLFLADVKWAIPIVANRILVVKGVVPTVVMGLSDHLGINLEDQFLVI